MAKSTLNLKALRATAKQIFPGLVLSVVIAMAATFISEHYNAPAMLLALLLGLSLSFLSEEETSVAPGVDFAASTLLKLGIILLGTRISAEIVITLGWRMIALMAFLIAATISVGLITGKLLKQSKDFSVLTAGAVAICGASAALALSSVLPKNEQSEKNLFFTVLCVTMLSTATMILYPVLLKALNFSDLDAGIFMGATIHDVAQVVGAGFSYSDPAGETATLVKLIRVTFLAPVVIIVSYMFRVAPQAPGTKKSKISLPWFIYGFLGLAALNSFGLIPEALKKSASLISNWALLSAIAAVGVRTSLREALKFGPRALALVVIETVFLALLTLASLKLFFA